MVESRHTATDPAVSVWVSANAGTGKTSLLVGRVLRLLLAGSKPWRILCLTYTEAAAAEMKNRVYEELAAWAVSSEKQLGKKLADLTGKAVSKDGLKRARQLFAQVLESPEGIRIQTIHAFCRALLARFPIEAGVAPHMTVIDDRTSGALLREARMRLFTNPIARDEKALAESLGVLSATLSEKGFEELLTTLIRERRKLTRVLAGSDALVRATYERVGHQAGASVKALVKEHFNYNPEECAELRRLGHIFCEQEAARENDKPSRTTLTGEALCKFFAEPCDWAARAEAYCDAFFTEKGEPIKTLVRKEYEKQIPGVLERIRLEQERVISFFERYRSLRVAEMSTHVANVAESLLEIYRHLKTTHGYLDFDDLILKTLSLFRREGMAAWVLYKLDGGLDHMLVDEAQDTSPEQWEVIATLANEFFAGDSAQSSERTLFVVGDEKQSIYSFQGAEPRAFDEQRRHFRAKIEGVKRRLERVYLHTSFRSTGPVLQAVDAVFASDAMRQGVVFQENKVEHELHRKDEPGRVELWPLVSAEEKPITTAWDIPEERQSTPPPEAMLSQRIAATIDGWIKEGRLIHTGNGVKRVSPGDILILLRSRGRLAPHLIRALKRKQIPVAGIDRLILEEHIAVQDMMALAEFLLLPEDDLSLAVILKSPLIGISEEELFTLAHGREKKSLWLSLRDHSGDPRFKAAYQLLHEMLARTDYLPPYELFTWMLDTQGGRKRMVARLGEECIDPLDEFLSQALLYEQTHPASLQGFLYWLQADTTTIKRDLDQGQDEVRIMTVHGAKGLEAPIVFLPDAAQLPQPVERFFWDEENGNRIFLWSPYTEFNDANIKQLAEWHRDRDDEEHRRLLYVALTRAANELYICGYESGKEIKPESWYERVRRQLQPLMSEVPVELSGAESFTVWRMEKAGQAKAPTITAPAMTKLQKLPLHLTIAPKPEPIPPKPLAPSQPSGKEGKMISPAEKKLRYRRGLLIHRLLQTLPEVTFSDRESSAARFLARQARDLSEGERQALVREVMRVLQDDEFAPVFGAGSQAEVPVSGIIQDENGTPVVVNGQIDRLVVHADGIWIIDYKTNREPPSTAAEIPESYRRQMSLYKKLLQRIYPGKPVHGALVWTAGPLLMPIAEDAPLKMAATS